MKRLEIFGLDGLGEVCLGDSSGKLIVDACSNLIITADATLNSGQSIARVEFFADGLLIGSDDTAPYEFTHAPALLGAQSLSAIAVVRAALNG